MIIGANSVVTHDVPNDSVAVGCPAKKIKTVDEYYNKVVSSGRIYPTAGMSINEKRNYFENEKKK